MKCDGHWSVLPKPQDFKIMKQRESEKAITSLNPNHSTRQMIASGNSLRKYYAFSNPWFDMDTSEDLILAEQFLGGSLSV
jgi:NDP-sugar pyrophosphorylase family protein